jgi:hypothetical protein
MLGLRAARSLPARRSDELSLRRSRLSLVSFDEEVVRVAVPPALARLEGTDHRVLRRVVVLRRVFVGGVIAASDVTAFEAEPQVDPGVAGGEAFLASVRCIRAVVAGFSEMSTEGGGHVSSVR